MPSLTTYTPPVVVTRGSTDPDAPLVVLLHGRGSDEQAIIDLAGVLPEGPAYAAVRAPIAEGGGYAWFVNRGIGRPIAESLAQTIAWFREWLDEVAPAGRPVTLIGFSGGAAAAGGLVLDDPQRFAGAAILYGTLPFDAGVDTGPARLASLPMFVAHGEHDRVIPAELQQRTWEYLHGASGAATFSHRDASAHQLSPAALHRLGGWLSERLGYVSRRGLHPVGVREGVVWESVSGGELPQRSGRLPSVSFEIPQRQLDQNAPLELQERVFGHVAGLPAVSTQASAISVPGARAFVLDHADAAGTPDSFIVRRAGEFAHLHPGYDGSLHVTLPQPYAADVIAKGWGVTHPLAGVRLAPGMVLLFGPRDEQELATVTAVLDEAHAFATGKQAA
jgi:phospholipase/carboxylesterase